jgi:magnesium-transporting ATPase (P-type)
MIDQRENDKTCGKEKRRSAGIFSIATFNDLLIWVGVTVAVVLMILFAIGLYCLDAA